MRGRRYGQRDDHRAARLAISAARRALGFVAVLVAFVGVALAVARMPDGTDAGSLVVRVAIALVIGGALVFVVRRMLGVLADPPPPAPERLDARETEVVYECPTCGTRLRLEVAATAKAPRHCGEEMEPAIRAR